MSRGHNRRPYGRYFRPSLEQKSYVLRGTKDSTNLDIAKALANDKAKNMIETGLYLDCDDALQSLFFIPMDYADARKWLSIIEEMHSDSSASIAT